MKSIRPIPFVFLVCLLFSPLFSQNNNLDSKYHERLYHLGKVWGYAKYFHPAIVNCSFDWDEELLKTIDLMKNITSDVEFNDLLVTILEKPGVIPAVSLPIETFDEALSYNLNLNWFDDPIFNDDTRAILTNIKDNYRSTHQCKLGEAFNGGNPTFDRDQAYFQNSGHYPNEAQRILAIFRYWNIINYFFPYKYQMDQDWDITLRQFIPPIVDAKNAMDYHLSFREMTTYINDTHAFFSSEPLNEYFGFYFAPFVVKYIENQTVIVNVHESVKGELSIGDIITQIDDVDINFRREQIRKYTAASNEPTLQRNINYRIVRGKIGGFSLRIKKAEGEKTIELTRKPYRDYASLYAENTIAYEKRTSPDGCQVGYIDMAVLETQEVPAMFSEFKNLPAIIVDVRNYPNGTLWSMVDFLYPGPINFSAFTQPNIRFPGILNFYQHAIGIGGLPYKGRLIILFNEETQSQAEFTVMGLEKHPNALKIGSQTAGADGNVSRVYLPGNIETVFTGLGVFYPDGTETQRIGIVPDITITPTIQGIKEGRDEVLELALDCQYIGTPNVTIPAGMDLLVFPNPTATSITVFSNKGFGKVIKVVDALGRLIEAFEVTQELSSYNLDVQNYTTGMYLIYILDEKEVIASEKFIKM